MPLLLPHDVFFGELQSSQSLEGITLSHRIASSPPEEVEVHTHPEAHFVLITGGGYVSSARELPAPGTTLIYNPPGTTHRDHFREGQGSFFTISVSNERLAETTGTELLPVATYLFDRRACGLARALLMECARWDACSALKAESLYSELVEAAALRPVDVNRLPPPWLRAAYELIQDCYSEEIDIRSVAETVGVHPAHLARGFRTFVGCTPGDLLRARRIEKGAEFLLRTDLPLAQVALGCGFADQAQFTKAFRHVYGTPPGAYRRVMLRFDKTAHAQGG